MQGSGSSGSELRTAGVMDYGSVHLLLIGC